jgi:hypothetical protein
MSQDWYLINSPNTYSGYENDYIGDYGTDSFGELLDTFVGEDVTIYDSTLTDSNVVKAIVSDKTGNTSLKKFEISLLLPLNSCATGMYAKYKNKYWLVTSYVNDNVFYQKAIAELCTYTIKFQHPVTGAILSYPCITSNRIQGTGDKETSVMTLPDGRKLVILPYDESTILLQNSESKTWRFFIDNHPATPRVYKLSFADTTSSTGLIELYCDEDKFNSQTDSVELGVCDYFTPHVTPEPPNPEVPTEIVTITSDTTNNQVTLGITHTFSATFKNELGEDVENVIAQYSVDNTYGGKVNLVDNGDGTATITVGDYNDVGLVNKQFTLQCYDARHGFDDTVLLTIVGLF